MKLIVKMIMLSLLLLSGNLSLQASNEKNPERVFTFDKKSEKGFVTEYEKLLKEKRYSNLVFPMIQISDNVEKNFKYPNLASDTAWGPQSLSDILKTVSLFTEQCSTNDPQEMKETIKWLLHGSVRAMSQVTAALGTLLELEQVKSDPDYKLTDEEKERIDKARQEWEKCEIILQSALESQKMSDELSAKEQETTKAQQKEDKQEKTSEKKDK